LGFARTSPYADFGTRKDIDFEIAKEEPNAKLSIIVHLDTRL
jgi:hypothetical protein